jgi:hypothetical protein
MWEEQDAIKSREAEFEAKIAAMDAAHDAEILAGLELDSYDDLYWSDMEYEREEAERKFEEDERIRDDIYYLDMLDREMFYP